MSWVGHTKQLPTEPEEPGWHEPTRRGGALSLFTGVVTAAVVLLALLVGGARALGEARGFAGPPTDEVIVHALGALGVLLLRVGVRRARLPGQLLAALLTLAVLGTLLGVYWYGL